MIPVFAYFFKLEDDILAVKLIENVGKTIASQLQPTPRKPASVGQINDDQGKIYMDKFPTWVQYNLRLRYLFQVVQTQTTTAY